MPSTSSNGRHWCRPARPAVRRSCCFRKNRHPVSGCGWARQAEPLPELDDDQAVAGEASSATASAEDAQLRTALVYAAVNDELEAAIAEWEFAHDSQPIPANVLAEAQDTALAINQLVDALFATTG